MNPGGWLAYAQFLDSALPVGGFSHSFGLETLVQEGDVRSPADLRAYIEAMLAFSWAPADAMAVKAVYVYAPDGEWEKLWLVDRMLHVQRISAESRDGALKMGRRLLRLGRSMHPRLDWEPLGDAVRAGACFGTHPLVHGWIAWQLGVPLDTAAQGYLYAAMTGCIGCALRLMPIGQTEGQSLLAALLPEAERAWRAAAAADPLEWSCHAPANELAMMRHETLYSRLFMS
ncbi:MAG: urease accessory protein UreF [Paenibacillaceae bacterium]|nr:urease accessory protein UreF [Paenibacillaceae bacterium]